MPSICKPLRPFKRSNKDQQSWLASDTELCALRPLEERLGSTLMRAEKAIHDLAARFGLKLEELSLDLGPLERTI